MKEIYSNNIFNWVLVIISVLTLIDTSNLLSQEFEFLNVLTLRIILFVIPILSILSFFVSKLSKEFYSRLFILANLIALPLAIYYRFLVDKLFYLVIRTDLVSSPVIHLKFLIGIILFYLSIKFSQQSKPQRQNGYGILMIIYGLFSVILSFTKIFDYDPANFSIIEFVAKLILSIGIIFIGNRLRINKMKFRTSIIITVILAIICGML